MKHMKTMTSDSIALTHVVSPNINRCELTHRQREPIEYALAVEQHERYCQLLRDCGLHVIELLVNRDFPDSTFIEDTAVVFDEIAVMASIGAESRRMETKGVETEIANYREIAHIRPPATLDGGDVVQMGKDIFVGLSLRTNTAGINSLREILRGYGYRVTSVELNNCLHLKSACTAVSDHAVLVNPDWLDMEPFSEYRIIPVPVSEPWAANVLRIRNILCLHSGFEVTVELLQTLDFEVKTVDISELLKAEAGMTCSSILFRCLR
jgi:dimethylargininase